MSREYQVGGQFISESDTRQYQVGDIYINETVSVSPTGNRINIVICSGENDMQLLKQSTAATVLVGPVLDSTGAAYASAVIGDFNITKNGTTAAMASAATATHSHNGMYLILFTTGNTDTLGRLDISCNKATYAMGVRTFEVLTASTFDAIVTNAATAAGGLCDIQRMAGTALTGRDIGASVLLSSGTGTGQVKLSSGYIAPDWGDVGNPTTTLNLSGTTIATTQKVDVETIKTNAVVNGGTITFPSNATLASTTNITAAAGVVLGNTAHGGSSATITLQSVNISNSTGDAVTIVSTGSDGHALYASANGGGDGFHIVGGATGHGFHLQGGSTSGDGIHAIAQTSGDGIRATGAGAGVDINGTLSAVTIVNGLAANTITASSIATDAVTEIQSGLSTYNGSDTSGVTTLLSRLSSDRAGYLDNLSGGAVALASGVTVTSIGAGVITATSIASDAITDAKVASDVTIASVTGSVGSISGVTFPSNFGVLSISASTGLVDITQTAADKVWDTTTRVLTAGTNIVLAKGVGVTGFNDISTANVATELATYDGPTNAEMIAAFTEIKGATWSSVTDTLEAIRDRGDVAWTTATGFSTHSAADVWAVGTRVLTAGTNIVLAKGVGITGFNDIAATDIVSGGAITTSSGAVSSVTLVGTLTTYTGNTPQTGDVYAQTNSATFGLAAIKGYVDDIGVAGAGLTALGDTRLANLDALISSRMATYTQPTGFLAATFPTTVASTTNITGGTITTVTNLTNLPNIPNNWFTAAGLATDAVTEIQSGLATSSSISALDGKIDTIDNVVDAILVDTDEIGTAGAGLTSVVDIVWDDVIASHLGAGSMGDALYQAAIHAINLDDIYVAPDNDGITAIKAKTDELTFTESGKVDSNVLSIYSSALAAQNLNKSTLTMMVGVVGNGSTTSSIVTSSFSLTLTDVDQLKGRVVIFLYNTTTGGIRAEAASINGSTSGATPTFDVTQLTSSPVSGDTFIVV